MISTIILQMIPYMSSFAKYITTHKIYQNIMTAAVCQPHQKILILDFTQILLKNCSTGKFYPSMVWERGC